ncbi:MAG: DegT/DnrJ/EryC1/StrS family aminotransferase, partial [Flavobacteriales bacterium]
MIPIAKPCLDEKDAQAAHDTILTGWITQGPRVQEFEEKFATYTGSQYAVAVSN